MAKREKRGAGRSKREVPRGNLQSSTPLALDTVQPAHQEDTPLTSEPQQPPLATGRIYTQCPLCKATYRITVAQLRQGQGEAYCLECQASFNALPALAETADRAGADPLPSRQAPRLGKLEAAGAAPRQDTGRTPERTGTGILTGNIPDTLEPPRPAPTTGCLAWGIGAALMAALLALQVGWFAGPELEQNERLRPWLVKACGSLGCRLPPYHAPRRIQIISHDLSPAPDGIEGYEFTLVLANQAPLPQAFPSIKLSLEAFNGSPAAVREFQPEEYLSEPSPNLMPLGEPIEIHLLLAKPNREIGGFSFELR